MALAGFRAPIAALLAVLLAVWPAAPSAHVRFFCRMMDRVVDSCCCGSGAAAPQVAPEPEARVPDCCERLTQGALPNVEPRRDGVDALSAPLLPPTNQVQVLPAVARETLPPAHEAKRTVGARGPPLFLANCALLI
jgi:hypothetical protein